MKENKQINDLSPRVYISQDQFQICKNKIIFNMDNQKEFLTAIITIKNISINHLPMNFKIKSSNADNYILKPKKFNL